MLKKFPRLEFALSQLLSGMDVWDICCDHGYLGGAAYKSNNFKNIYFVDPVPSIMEKLKLKFNKFVFQPNSTYQAFFLQLKAQDLKQRIEGNFCVLGVGGELIFEILESLLRKQTFFAQRLILCPHKDEDWLIKQLQEHFSLVYKITFLTKVTEKNRERVFIILDRIQVESPF